MATVDNLRVDDHALTDEQIASIFAAGNWDKLRSHDVPHLSDYFGVWAIQSDALERRVEMFNGLDLSLHIKHYREAKAYDEDDFDEKPQARDLGRFDTVADGQVAVIELQGEMMKAASSFGGASTVRARRQIRKARNDATVKSILLYIDSPGGTVAGTEDLANDVAAAAKQKPVVTFFEDLGASAAYWVGSQATTIFANNSALVGSIGTFAVLADYSAAAEAAGIKVHVIKAGTFKGAGVAGTEVSDELLTELQRRVNDFNDLFLAGVARGRSGLSISRVRELADGRVHLAQQARTLGLIDQVGSLESAIGEALRLAQARGAKAVTTTNNETQAASYGELKKALPNATAEFVCECLEAGLSVAEAKDVYLEKVEKERDEAKAAADKAAEDQKAKQVPKGSIDVVPDDDEKKPAATAGTGRSAAIAKWNALISEAQQANPNKPRNEIVASLCRDEDNAELYEQYLEAYNQKHAHLRDPRTRRRTTGRNRID